MKKFQESMQEEYCGEHKFKKGSVLNDNNLTFKRPGFGISPIEWDNIIGKKLNKDIVKDHVLKWDDIE